MFTQRNLLAVIVVLGVEWSAAYVGAQEPVFRPQENPSELISEDEAEPSTFGTRTGFSTVWGSELQPETYWEYYPLLWRLPTGTACTDSNGAEATAYAQIEVPEGARLSQFRFWAWDSSADLDLLFTAFQTCQPAGSGGPVTTPLADTIGTVGSFGNWHGFQSLGNVTANNRDCVYWVRVVFNPGGAECADLQLEVRKLQFRWVRQVSPAPPTATFSDVPTSHPFFRHIEALAASGVTSGCTADEFCPNAPLTRGQMAVFLARALGLQWPN